MVLPMSLDRCVTYVSGSYRGKGRGLHDGIEATLLYPYSHYHRERPHQGKGNVILFPNPADSDRVQGEIRCRERLGGLLTYYYREAG